MLIPVLLFVLGLVLLIKGGDWFVDGASAIAQRFHIPEILIGATVVSIGTTLPEVMVSATSALGGQGEIAYGNAIGSIICNTSLIAAVTVAIRPSVIKRKALILPLAFFYIAAAFYSFVAYTTGFFSRTVGAVLLLLFAAYMIISVFQAKNDMKNGAGENEEQTDGIKKKSVVMDVVNLVLGAACIALGARLLVDNGTIIAEKMGVPESVIALTFVALGTSLPELVTALTSLVKGHGALSLGNIIGANMFNLVLVSGVSTVLAPFAVPASKLVGGMNASLVVDIPLMIAVMSFLVIPALVREKLSRFQGIVLLFVYGSYCVFQFCI